MQPPLVPSGGDFGFFSPALALLVAPPKPRRRPRCAPPCPVAVVGRHSGTGADPQLLWDVSVKKKKPGLEESVAAVGGLLARAGVELWGRPQQQQQQRACGSRVGPLPFLLPAAPVSLPADEWILNCSYLLSRRWDSGSPELVFQISKVLWSRQLTPEARPLGCRDGMLRVHCFLLGTCSHSSIPRGSRLSCGWDVAARPRSCPPGVGLLQGIAAVHPAPGCLRSAYLVPRSSSVGLGGRLLRAVPNPGKGSWAGKYPTVSCHENKSSC